ncbi:hypothetical protein EON82_19780 [bacterium]|nr:MAG: hypothetical protein EON82_19780 [bacterium]
MNEEKEIRDVLMAAPMDRHAPDALKRKLRVLANEKRRKRINWWSLSPVALVGVTALGMVAITMMPAKAAAKTFDLVVAAAQSVNAFQFSVVSNEKSNREVITIAGADGHVYMRSEEGGFFQLDPGSLTIVDSDAKTATRFKFGNLMDADQVVGMVQNGIAEGMKEFDLKKMLKEYEEKYGKDNIWIGPVTRENGHGVYHVKLAAKDQPERVEIVVDSISNLPERLVVDKKEDGLWKNEVTMEMRFGGGVDPNLLRSTIPANIKIEEVDLGAMVGEAMKGMDGLGKAFEKMGEKHPRP